MHLADKILSNDPLTAQLLAPGGNPFAPPLSGEPRGAQKSGNKEGTAPVLRFVRAELYEVCISVDAVWTHCFLTVCAFFYVLVSVSQFDCG